jgi:hypothetical protein
MLDRTQEDNSQETAVQASPAGDGILVAKQKCHPDRSAAKWRDLLFLHSIHQTRSRSAALPFVIPTEA